METTLGLITGYTINLINPTDLNTLSIEDKNGNIIMQISSDGDLYYSYNGNLVKVNAPEDLVEAFSETIFNYTGKTPDDILIEKYLDKIFKNKKSKEYMAKLELEFRKRKIKKINN